MAVTFVSKGPLLQSRNAFYVTLPAGYQDGDMLIMFCESANQTLSVFSPAGWTQIGSQAGTGTVGGYQGVGIGVFYRFVSGAQVEPVIQDSGDHTSAIIACFRGIDTTTPFNGTATDIKAVASTAISCPAITTTFNNCMIVNAIALDKDALDTDTVQGYTNANLVSLTERIDETNLNGQGGGIAVCTGYKEVAGDTGVTTATQDSDTPNAYLTFALNPIILTEEFIETGKVQTISATLLESDHIIMVELAKNLSIKSSILVEDFATFLEINKSQTIHAIVTSQNFQNMYEQAKEIIIKAGVTVQSFALYDDLVTQTILVDIGGFGLIPILQLERIMESMMLESIQEVENSERIAQVCVKEGKV